MGGCADPSPRPATPKTVGEVEVGPVECVETCSGNPQDAEAVARTTVILRNMPDGYLRDDVVQLLDQEGFKACYDFIYMPVDFSSHAGFGYVFINMASPESALAFLRHFQGFDRWAVDSDKEALASWSSVQG